VKKPNSNFLIFTRNEMYIVNVVIIVQARMTSTRLPGKVLKTVLEKPLLMYQIERLKQVRLANEIVIATTTKHTDEPIVSLSRENSIPHFRGSEEDVLSRYYETAKAFQADAIVRVTSDCPVIDAKVIDKVIQLYVENYPRFDYVSNTLTRSYPRGLDAEIFSFKALSEAHHETNVYADREHVTPFIYRHSERYNLGNLINEENQSRHRWTVDTEEDFELIKRIITYLYPQNPNFEMQDALHLFEMYPDWYSINAHVEQKKYGE
jgi:spore coat polysaccharide biosynthesis protein SpsF